MRYVTLWHIKCFTLANYVSYFKKQIIFTKISVQCIMCCLLLNRKAGRDKMGTLYNVSQKISALILTSDKSRQKQQNCYNFSKYNLISVFYFIVI
jgi:hypothetical protein